MAHREPNKQPGGAHRLLIFLSIGLSLGLAIVSALTLAWPWSGVAVLLGWAMLAIAAIDLKTFIIPDALSLPAIPLGLLASGHWLDPSQPSLVDPAHVLGMLAGGLGFYGVRAAYDRLRAREGLGLGDVKLAAAAGAWTGWRGLVDVVLLASVTAIVIVALAGLLRRRKQLTITTAIPFGTFLAPAIWVVWMLDVLGRMPDLW